MSAGTSSTPAPTLWFGAPQIASNMPNPAGSQFMNLFTDPAAWQVTASQSAGFVLTEPFVLNATTAQLTEALDYLKQNHLKVMMVAGMVPVQPNGIGNGVEGYMTPANLQAAVQRISSLGGTLDYIAMDSPLIYGHLSSAGAQLSNSALAQQVAGNVALVKAIFPNVQVEDAEGLSATPYLAQWAQAFQQATGTPIAQFDADVNWGMANWQSALETYAAAVRSTGAAFGIIGNATSAQQTDSSWTLAAEANIATSVADPLIRPSDVIVGTWDANPTVTLPEGLSGTLAHVAAEDSQVAPLYTSGILAGGGGVPVTTVAPPASFAGTVVDAVAGAAVGVPGLAIAAPASPAEAAMTFAVVLTDVSGALGATASGQGHVGGAGTNVLTLTGTLADINAELASLTYTAGAAAADTIDVTTYDGAGLVDDHLLNVSVATPLAISLPAGLGAAALYQNIFGQAPGAATQAAVASALAGGQTLAQVAAPWLAQAQSTIAQLCEQVQGASAPAATVASLAGALAGGESLAQIRASLAGNASVQQELAAIYQASYGQAPSAAQLASLTQRLASGTGLAAVDSQLLANSPAEAQITSLFKQVTGQAPGAADLVADTRALLTGTSLAVLQGQIAASAQVQGNLAELYQNVYNQAPTPAQLASLTAELSATTSYAQLQAQFTSAAQSILTGLFQSVLNRTPTGAELAAGTQALITGAKPLASLVANLSYSAESAANVTGIYQQVIGQAPPQAMITELELCLGIGRIPLVQLGPDLAAMASVYQQITGQPVTAAALTPLMYDELNHAPTSEIRDWVAYSAQVNQILTSTYLQLFGNAIGADQMNTIRQGLLAGTTTMASVLSGFAAQAAADVPVISGVAPTQSATANSHVIPFGTTLIADGDPGAIETVTVTLTGGGSLTSGGVFNAAHTVYTEHGSASLVSACLHNLIFVPPSGGGTSQLTITVQNGAGNASTATVSMISQTHLAPAATAFLFAPAQGATLAGQYPSETFVFSASGFGADTITGFNPLHGVIELPASLVGSFAQLQADESPVSGGTLISLGASESIYLPGVAAASLHAANFAFV